MCRQLYGQETIMAGFDFSVRSTNRQRSFVRALLKAAHRETKGLEVGLKFRWHANEYYVTVDGRLTDMQVLWSRLVIVLRAFASSPVDGLLAAERRQLAARVASSFGVDLREIEETVAGCAYYFGTVPNSFEFDPGCATHLRGRLDAYKKALVLYSNGELSPDQVAEDAHTIAELLMRRVASERSASFPTLVAKCFPSADSPGDVGSALMRLNTMRRDAKHKGQSISILELNALLPEVNDDLHQLCGRLR